MDWKSLLSERRLRRPGAETQEGRRSYQQDLDRIVFSSAFRRLANKTQVHPLSPNDNVHTRLTHSIEVASVGRSLGNMVGAAIASKLKDPTITADVFGYIIQAACLAHDIGNPPFGHSGEDAIRLWFAKAERNTDIFDASFDGARREDFRFYEGNAQGFRILTQLENNKHNGGLQLTYAVLGTFSKYPRSSIVRRQPGDAYPGGKKVGFFDAERAYFTEVADGLGLVRRQAGENYWCRHPLTFLVEAADDICYAIIDIEDGYSLGYLSFREAAETLAPIAGDRGKPSPGMEESEIISKYRAEGIGQVIKAAADVFVAHEAEFLDGTFASSLVESTAFKADIANALDVAKRKIYWSDRKTRLEIAGSEIIQGLLDIFSEVVIELNKAGFEVGRLKGRAQGLARLMGRGLASTRDNYTALLCVTDFVSGMTDRYAVEVYQTLKGIATDV